MSEKPFGDVFSERNVSRTVERHAIVVVDPAQVGQLQMSGERCCLGAYAFHHVAIAMGAPGCPELACCTASIASVRMVLMHNVSSCLLVNVCSLVTMGKSFQL